MQGEKQLFLVNINMYFPSVMLCAPLLYIKDKCPYRAGLDNEAFTQLPNGTQVEVTGTEGEWI